MAIFDSGEYSQESTNYILSLIPKISENKDIYNDYLLYSFNIYLGDKFIGFPDGAERFHVCKNTEDGFLFMVFHDVPRKDVVGKNVEFEEFFDTCITMIWTAKEFAASHVRSAIHFADEVCRNIELATGRPCPIPLRAAQHPTNFEVTEVDMQKAVAQRIVLQDPRTEVPELTPRIGVLLNALMGFDANYQKAINQPPYSIISVSARWQQKAIRGQGAGEYADCVVCCAIWAETFFVQITAELMRLSGEPINDIENELRRGLPSFLNRYLGQKFLKGNWDHTNEKSEVGRWYQKAYRLRNLTAHTGKIPTESEARNCYEITHAFVKHVSKGIGKLKSPKLKSVSDFFSAMSSL